MRSLYFTIITCFQDGKILRKLILTLIPMCIGGVLLLLSWYLSYPISIDSPYDFAYNHFSYLYWLGLAVLFASFFIVAMETKNNSLRWAMTIGTVLLIFSQAYFYYMVPGSDANQTRGLTEYFISTGDLSLEPYHDYYQWPLSFILSKTALSITGLDLRCFEFILYGVMSFVITSLIYLYISKVRANAYVAVIAFFIILLSFFNFQWIAPFSLSLCLILLLFYLDSLSGKREVSIAMLIIFTGMTFTHILTPLFFVVYCFLMYIKKKNKKHLNLFLLTSIIYALVLINNLLLAVYLKQLTNFFFFEILFRVQISTTGLTAPQPYIGVIAQFFSRTVVITTTLVTGLGFIIFLRRKKLRVTHYVMLLTGAVFAVTLLISPSAYHQLSNRAYFLICIPASLGASYLCESKFKKFFKPFFLILLVLFSFTLMNQTFFDREIFFQTKEEYQCANFMIDNINWNTSSRILSPFRFEQYLIAKSSSATAIFWSDFSEDFPKNMLNCDYVAYTIGLAKSLLAANYSVETSFREFDVNHFNLIYNSGNFSYILSK
jgi:hypothetical protein